MVQAVAGASVDAPSLDGETLDAVIVGAGFAGMYSLHRLLKAGCRVHAFEAGDNVGGTWYWNRYPGARCDIQSMEYSYGFDEDLQQSWQWSEKYAPQPEILAYANHVADRFNLRGHISFSIRVESAHYQEDTDCWRITTRHLATGERVSFNARFCIMATGCLSSVNRPDFKGMEQFQGPIYHTGQWPHEGVDFTGAQVGIIGTGSSAIQSIPIIADQAKHLTVFQRTANFSIPAHNASLDKQFEQDIKRDYAAFREENRRMMAGLGARNPRHEDSALDADDQLRQTRFEERWQTGGLGFLGAFGDLGVSREANDLAAEFVRGKIRAIVKDPATAELLTPKSIIGCKRLCVDTQYYETFNRSNVTLVDVSENSIEEITRQGLITGGREYPFEQLVLATGFDAMTGTLMRIDIRGRGGLTLKEKWAAGPRTFLGISTHGFPNLFTISGPGSPSVLSNMMVTIEQHVDWVTDCINYMMREGRQSIEASLQAEDEWVSKGNAIADQTLFPHCNSWYLGANVPGKPRVFMPFIGGLPMYISICNEVAANNYRGFEVA